MMNDMDKFFDLKKQYEDLLSEYEDLENKKQDVENELKQLITDKEKVKKEYEELLQEKNRVHEMLVHEEDDVDSLLEQAIELAIDTGLVSTTWLQRKFRIGYNRAGRILNQMEERGIIGSSNGSKPREVLISKERWIELKGNNTIADN